MNIAIFSDSHDHLDLIEKAISQVKSLGIVTGIHLGDYCMPYVIDLLGKSGITWYGVWGNNDGDRLHGQAKSAQYPSLTLYMEDVAELTLDNRLLFLTHYPKFAELAAKSGGYDAVFHGHSHQIRNEYMGKTLTANPGAVSGIRTANRPTFGIFHTEDNTFEIIDIR